MGTSVLSMFQLLDSPIDPDPLICRLGSIQIVLIPTDVKARYDKAIATGNRVVNGIDPLRERKISARWMAGNAKLRFDFIDQSLLMLRRVSGRMRVFRFAPQAALLLSASWCYIVCHFKIRIGACCYGWSNLSP